jgi:hypothetical protein
VTQRIDGFPESTRLLLAGLNGREWLAVIGGLALLAFFTFKALEVCQRIRRRTRYPRNSASCCRIRLQERTPQAMAT